VDARRVPRQSGGLVRPAAPEERRPYGSARRQQQAAETRALVLGAATSLFADRGWSATGMRHIANEAGVAVETVYANFGSKTELLLTAIDVGVVGDAEPVSLSQRPEFAALGVGSIADRITTAARLLSGINQRTWGLRRALNEAAGSEPQLATKLHELETRRRDNIRQGVEMVIGRPVDEDLLDGLWVVMGADVFYLLTQIGGRPVEDYERWLATTIHRLLNRVGPETRTRAGLRRDP
jgi:AcrR family transcriptional regulator